MTISLFNHKAALLLTVLLLTLSVNSVSAQTTSFSYAGTLNDNGSPANGDYDFEYKLFDAISAGAQQGATLQQLNVTVTNGVYRVTLDFGAAVFPGADRFLEISYRQAGGSAFTVLSPRQQILSVPYAIKSLSAASADGLSVACVNCVTGSQISSVNGNTVTGAIPVASVPAGSNSYIQNTTNQQLFANFNILGNGTLGGTLSANVVNANSQFNINGTPILRTVFTSVMVGANAGSSQPNPYGNAIFGNDAGAANTGGNNNSIFGNEAGKANTSGSFNSFFGYQAGLKNTTGPYNSFFGSFAGIANTTGNANAFFGSYTGYSNTSGLNNAFFGFESGNSNTTGGDNAFVGYYAGQGNTSGTFNTFYGAFAGDSNTTGNNNTIIGQNADVTAGNLSFATAIGSGATVGTSNTVVLGRSSDSVRVPGTLAVSTLGTTGITPLCRNVANQIATCSSSLRYKIDVRPFSGGLDVVKRLRPITFTWRDGAVRDIGFGAEEVEKVEPLLTIHNDKGEIEGVKYGQVTTVLVNAIQQQQVTIEQQQRQIDALKKLVCLSHSQADICK